MRIIIVLLIWSGAFIIKIILQEVGNTAFYNSYKNVEEFQDSIVG